MVYDEYLEEDLAALPDDEPWALAIIPGVGVVDLGPEVAEELMEDED